MKYFYNYITICNIFQDFLKKIVIFHKKGNKMAKQIKETTHSIISFFHKVDNFLYEFGEKIL